jgi:hypothetical protein
MFVRRKGWVLRHPPMFWSSCDAALARGGDAEAELQADAGLRHARTLLAGQQWQEASAVLEAVHSQAATAGLHLDCIQTLLLLAKVSAPPVRQLLPDLFADSPSSLGGAAARDCFLCTLEACLLAFAVELIPAGLAGPARGPAVPLARFPGSLKASPRWCPLRSSSRRAFLWRACRTP